MSEDKAMTNPGPMGWGVRTPPRVSSLMEKAALEMFYEQAPRFFTERVRKDPIPAVLAKVKDLQSADGWDNGFSFPHFERLLNQDKTFDWIPQLIGSCVASGGGVVVVQRALAELFLLDQENQALLGGQYLGPSSFSPFLPYSYRAGRRLVPINGGRSNGADDGSLCSYHIRGLMEGMLPCSTLALQSDRFPEPTSMPLYRQWGADDRLFNQFNSIARGSMQLLESTQNKLGDDVVRNLLAFKPAMVCSDWAFRPDYQHPTLRWMGQPVWIYRRDTSTSWAHNMSFVGALSHNNTWYIVVQNTWGDFHKNGRYFVVPASLVDAWLRTQFSESMTIGELRLSPNAPAIEFL